MSDDEELTLEDLAQLHAEDIRMIEARTGLFYIGKHHLAGILEPQIIEVIGHTEIYENDMIDAVQLDIRCYLPNGNWNESFEGRLNVWSLHERRWFGSKEAALEACGATGPEA